MQAISESLDFILKAMGRWKAHSGVELHVTVVWRMTGVKTDAGRLTDTRVR